MSRKKNKKKTNPNSNNHNNHQQRHHQQQHNNAPAQVFQGKLETTRSGMAFVIVEGVERDIMVRPHDLNTAQNGDEVTVKVVRQGKGRAEGIVTKVITRKKNEFTGTLQVSENFAFLVSDKNATLPDIYIPLTALKGGVNGDKALVRITNWGGEPGKSRKPSGEVVEVLDARNAGDLAMKEILVDNGFNLHFPDEVMAEVDQLPLEIDAAEIAKRKDFRKILTFTIDPHDAKDFDDAISIRLLKTGNYEVGVHIADVSHYVRPGTALDAEGYKRATSVYLPDRVLPMLPEKISNELCSLRPHEDKLTFSAMFEMTKDGKVKNKWIGRTVIHSDHRFTYEDVQEVIESGEGPHYRDELLLLNTMARALRAERFANGAINFSSTEVKFQLDEEGKPIGVTLKESKEAHQLIEELMLLANRTVAEYVSGLRVNGNPVPFPYRVHDNPDEEKLKIFAVFALQFGYKFDMHTPETVAASFNKMLQLAQGRPEQHVLETMGIRTMSKAAYTTSNIGHYGLGFEHYAHFTSPIRRYPDVMVHRVLQECLSGDIHPDAEMESKCKHSSEMERKAMECERAGNKYKQVEYMQQFIGDTFEGVISGVSNFGFWVETVDTKCEGLVSIHSLTAKDEFHYNENEYALVGANTGIKFSIGDRVKIKVMAANLDKRQLDYDLDEPGYGRVAGDITQRNVGRGHGQHADRENRGNRNRNRDRDHKNKNVGDGEQAPVVPNEGPKRPIVAYQHKQPLAESGDNKTTPARVQPISGETPPPKLSKNQKRKQRAAAKKQRAIEEALQAKKEEEAGNGTFPVETPAAPISQPLVPAAGKKGKVKDTTPVKEKVSQPGAELPVPAKKEKKKVVTAGKPSSKKAAPAGKQPKETAAKAKPVAKPTATDKKAKKTTPEKVAKADLKKVKAQAKVPPAKKLKEAVKLEKIVAKTAKAATKALTSQQAKAEKKKAAAIAAAKKLKTKKVEAPAKKAPKKAEPAKKTVAKKVKAAPKKKAAATPAKKDTTKKSIAPAKKAVTAAKPKAKAKPVAKPKAAAKKAAVKAKPKAAAKKAAVKAKPKAAAKIKPVAKPKAAAKKAAKATPKAKAKTATKASPAKVKPTAKAAAKKAARKKKK
ncbi:ribonuclease R [Chitinophaga costaii]|uniref:Ribonuclease R n=1 Tax=Chitinophaga costaii TaxID=1335309 RepID=A0A1C4G383_9BACT|nr:ribonuclease R [Chitinophaga costaii]SCC62667.1 ribonuclease R [Chitinophaga costaii]